MIFDILFWYLAVVLSGWVVFPLVYRLLPFLPDRGFSLAKPVGLLLWGFLWWLLTSFHVLQNDTGGVILGLLEVAGLSGWALWRMGWAELRQWLLENRTTLIVIEGLFLVAFSAWVVVRGTYPDISGTEKPMELAFINAILHSPTFPPHDPWLSGYAISYYYFGYAMVAMLARFAGVNGEIAFNLALCTWFALTATAAYGIVFNLLALRGLGRSETGQPETNGTAPGRKFSAAHAGSLLAPVFLLLVSNLEGFLEVLHAGGMFWGDGGGFWKWLGIQELVDPPVEPFGWVPERLGGIWWWRASRVLQDFDLAGNPREIIDEFPFFSYLLGDLHPHVLSIPFVLVAIGLALHLYLRETARPDVPEWDTAELLRWIRLPETWLAILVLGGLAFLNTWDFPIYLALYGAAYVLAGYQRQGWKWELVMGFLLLMILLGLAGIVAYLPFYLGFQSQAGGILPSLVFFTRGAHLWVMFGALLLPVLAWLAVSWKTMGGKPALKTGVLFAVAVVAGLWLLSALLGMLVVRNPSLVGIYGSQGQDGLLVEAVVRRLALPGAWLTLLVILWLVWARLAGFRLANAPDPMDEHTIRPDAMVLLLVLLGSGLVLFPEFFYLRDQFGWRMNTIFKFYYQAWIVWSLAAAYASVVIWRQARGAGARLVQVAWVAVFAAALVYPYFGIQDRVRGFDFKTWTLDGADYLGRFSSHDLQAIRWLEDAPYGAVAEAVGGSYSGYARVATFSGQPGVLGWPGHESQWRGGAKEMGSREADLELLYRTRRWDQAQEILARYQIRYVYVGPMEKSKYGLNDTLFQRYLSPVFQNEQVTIYEVSNLYQSEE